MELKANQLEQKAESAQKELIQKKAETVNQAESKRAQIKEESKSKLPEGASKHVDEVEKQVVSKAKENSTVSAAVE